MKDKLKRQVWLGKSIRRMKLKKKWMWGITATVIVRFVRLVMLKLT